MARRHWCRFSDFLVYIFGCRERSLDCSQVQPRRRKEGFAGRTTIIISTSSGSQEITAGSCCPTNRSLGPEIPPRRQSPSKVKGEEKPRSALDPSTVERGQERRLVGSSQTPLWCKVFLVCSRITAPAAQPPARGIISSSKPAPPFPRWGFQA